MLNKIFTLPPMPKPIIESTIKLTLISLFYGASININLSNLQVFLKTLHFTNTEIALVASFEIIAIFFSAPFLQTIISNIGIYKSSIYSLIVRNIFLILLGFLNSKALLIITIFLFGAGGYFLFTGFQVWLNQITNSSNRGTCFGITGAGLSIGMAVGPFLLNLLNIKIGVHSFLFSAFISSLMIFPLWSLKETAPSFIGNLKLPLEQIITKSKVPILCGFIFEYVFFGLGHFIVLYGLSNGLDESKSRLIISYMVLFSIILNVPIGYIIDKCNKYNLLVIFSLVAAIAFYFIPHVITKKYELIIIFAIISACMNGIFVSGMALLGENFRGQELLAANAALSLMSASGAFSGIIVTGISIDKWGDTGLIISMVTMCSIFFLINATLIVKEKFKF